MSTPTEPTKEIATCEVCGQMLMLWTMRPRQTEQGQFEMVPRGWCSQCDCENYGEGER